MKKKNLAIAALGALCIGCSSLAIACADTTVEQTPKTGVAMINAFENWDDLKELEIHLDLLYNI